MTQLLSAGFARLWKNILFRVCILVFAALCAFSLIDNYVYMKEMPGTVYPLSNFFFGPFLLIGSFTSFFSPLFLGQEYSSGALHNKIIVGCSRARIYLSCFLTVLGASLIVCAGMFITILALGIPLFGPLTLAPRLILLHLLQGILMTAAFSGLATMVSCLSQAALSLQ